MFPYSLLTTRKFRVWSWCLNGLAGFRIEGSRSKDEMWAEGRGVGAPGCKVEGLGLRT